MKTLSRMGALLVAALGAFTVCSAADAVSPSTPAKAFANPNAATQLDATLKQLAKQDLFTGVVLIAKGDKVIFQGAYGPASREYGVPNTMDTQFSMASMSKMFTATSINILMERGKLRLDDPISKYLDASWLKPEIASRITIAQLLTHTGGLGSFFSPKYFSTTPLLYRNVADFKPLVVDSKLESEPGTKWSYSNTGFLLLGAIIEKVTGQSFFDFVKGAITDPVGMKHTEALELDHVNKGYAQGYGKEPNNPPPRQAGGADGPRPDYRIYAAQQAEIQRKLTEGGFSLRNNGYMHVVKGGPSGDMYTTAGDLLKFLNALLGGKLVGPETVKAMITPKPPAAPDWGYGIMMGDHGYGHSGSFRGIANIALGYPDGYRTIILSNIDAGALVAYDALANMAEGKH